MADWIEDTANKVIDAFYDEFGGQNVRPQREYVEAFDAICGEIHGWLNAAGAEADPVPAPVEEGSDG